MKPEHIFRHFLPWTYFVKRGVLESLPIHWQKVTNRLTDFSFSGLTFLKNFKRHVNWSVYNAPGHLEDTAQALSQSVLTCHTHTHLHVRYSRISLWLHLERLTSMHHLSSPLSYLVVSKSLNFSNYTPYHLLPLSLKDSQQNKCVTPNYVPCHESKGIWKYTLRPWKELSLTGCCIHPHDILWCQYILSEAVRVSCRQVLGWRRYQPYNVQQSISFPILLIDKTEGLC